MPKKPRMRNAIYDYLLDYFKNRYEESQAFRIRRSKPDDRKFPTMESIVDFVLDREELCESNTGTEPELGQTCISRGTVRKAVKQLVDENKIDLFHGSYEFVARMDRSLDYHPTLKIADQIDISIGIPNEIIVLTVPPEHTSSITNYLSALFYKRDILFIPIAGHILCISVFPKSVLEDPSQIELTAESPIGLRQRIEMAIHQFHYHYPEFPYGATYEFAYHISHNPNVVKRMTKEIKYTEQRRPYRTGDSLLRNIQEAVHLTCEPELVSPTLKIHFEENTDDNEESIGEPDQDEWDLMDSTISDIVDDEFDEYT
jgi:hypothetical protein